MILLLVFPKWIEEQDWEPETVYALAIAELLVVDVPILAAMVFFIRISLSG